MTGDKESSTLEMSSWHCGVSIQYARQTRTSQSNAKGAVPVLMKHAEDVPHSAPNSLAKKSKSGCLAISLIV